MQFYWLVPCTAKQKMRTYIYFTISLYIAYAANCRSDIPLDISIKIPKMLYFIEEANLLWNAKETFFIAIRKEDSFHPITNKGVPIDPDLGAITNRVELLRTTQMVFLRLKVFHRITEDGKIIMSYICYFYENGKWMLSDSRSYMDHKLQYMKKVIATMPFCETEDISIIDYSDTVACIAKHHYANIDVVTKDGNPFFSSAEACGNRIVHLAHRKNLGIIYLIATLADPDNNACSMTFLFIGSHWWRNYDGIDHAISANQKILRTVEAHYMTQKTIVAVGNQPFTPVSPYDVIYRDEDWRDIFHDDQDIQTNSNMRNSSKLSNPLFAIDADLSHVDVEKSHCSRVYHFSAPGSPYSLTSDEGYAFRTVEWYGTLVFKTLKHPPFHMVYYESNAMQSLYTFSLNGENIQRVKWLYAPPGYDVQEVQWLGTLVRAENFYPPPLTLDISKPFDSRFYEIMDVHTNHPGAAYVTPRKEFKLKAIVNGDVTIHVFKRAQRPTVGINTILYGYIQIFNPGAKAADDKYMLYKRADHNLWLKGNESDILHGRTSPTV